MTALQEAHRAVHLGEEAGNRRLPGARIPEEDEMLARCYFRKVALLTECLNLQERNESVDLLLDRLEPDEAVELRLQLLERSVRLAVRGEASTQTVDAGGQPLPFRTRALAQPVPGTPPDAAGLVERVGQHADKVPRIHTSQTRASS